MLDYSIDNPALRTPSEEWQPHAAQSEKSTEWWYLTAFVHDSAGNPYFLFWCLFHMGGQEAIPAPVELQKGRRFVFALVGITDYASDQRITLTPATVSEEAQVWDSANNAVRYSIDGAEGAWSFTGETMRTTLTSETASFDLELTGADQVMYAKDKLGIKGFIQEGDPEDRSYYYSLPRLSVRGRISFSEKDQNLKEVDVHGSGWVDRQWGDYLTKSWEWSSLRFSNGARVNLYNFANGHQVAAYQKADGATEWFDSFIVRQNGYVKEPETGTWVSWGWSYEFPLEIEGSRVFTLRPLSRDDVIVSPGNVFFEGPSYLVDDTTGKTVGIAVTESMDVRVMGNAPGGPNQH